MHRRGPAVALVSAVSLIALLVTSLSTAAEHGGFGEVLGFDDPDVAIDLRTLGSSAICFIDADSDGGYDNGEPVILVMGGGCGSDSRGRDLRLGTWGPNRGGERVGSGPDAAKPMIQPGGGSVSFWYFDANGNQRMDSGDTAYANIKDPTRGLVDVGDVRLAPFGAHAAGSVVANGDGDVGSGLLLLGSPVQVVGYVDTNGNGDFDGADRPYLNSDAGGGERVEIGDLRLMDVTSGHPYGSFVEYDDGDGDALLNQLSRAPCFADVDGSGAYSVGDPVYLDIDAACVGGLAVGDVRLTAVGNTAAGTRVVSSDHDLGLGLMALTAARVAYRDNDGDGVFSGGDLAYLDLVGSGSGVVDIGDVRLTPSDGPGGVVVRAGDPHAGASLVNLGLARDLLAFIAVSGGTVPTGADLFYFNIDGGALEGVEPRDVRLVARPGLPFGGLVGIGDGEVLPIIRSASGAVCFTGSQTYRAGETVYLSMTGGCPGVVASSMLRLSAGGGRPVGSLVRAADADLGAQLWAAAGTPEWRYFDANGDGSWSAGDRLYLDLINVATRAVEVGDIRITPEGSTLTSGPVAHGDADLARPLSTLGTVSSRTWFVDGNGNGAFDVHDVAYVNADGTGPYATVLDVRLALLPPRPVEPHEDPLTPDEPTQPTVPTEPTEPDAPADPSDPAAPEGPTMPSDSGAGGGGADEGDDGEGGVGVRTPGPGLVSVLIALLAGLAVRRR